MKSKIEIKKKFFFVEISFWFIALFAFLFIIDEKLNLAVALTAVLIHEFSHVLAIYLMGERVEKISFCAFNLNINTKLFKLTPLKKFIVAFSGPFVNIFLFSIFNNTFHDFAAVNLIYGCFQLLPINSLDGHTMLSTLNISYKKLKYISIIFCFIMASIGFLVLIQSRFNFSILAVSLMLLYTTLSE